MSIYTRVYTTDQTPTLRKQISEITIANVTYIIIYINISNEKLF